MKNILFVLLLCTSTFYMFAQDASVEKSTFGIQTGFLGIWGHNESRLSNSIVLRSELGLDTGIYSGNFAGNKGFTLEPRWYYNLNKRVSKSRRIDGNSGNFISIKTTYHPDLVVNSIADNLNFISDISIIPTWGIRRNVGKHLIYETGIGIGYVYYFEEENVFFSEKSGLALNLHLRIGYRF